MANILDEIFSKASALNKTVVLPEGEDKRVVTAASDIVKKGIAKIILLGDEVEIKKANPEVDLTGVTVLNPNNAEKADAYAELLYNLRLGKINKKTGLAEFETVEDAKKNILKDYTMFAALMVKSGDADGMVSGACHSTANTLRPALQVIKTKKGTKLVSCCFLMVAPKDGNEFCKDGCFVFADCALNQNPNSEELAYIALSSAETAQNLVGMEPKVAFLSHSSKGSAKHADIDKVVNAFNLFKEIAPDVKSEGELQLDSAIVPEVANLKAPGSTVAGQANVLIFPDLDAGNIGYKLVERLGGFTAVGPICQGFDKPVNDLSRGCKASDIVATVAITCLQ